MKYYKVRIWNSFGKSWEIITYLAFSDEYLAELKKKKWMTKQIIIQ